MADADAGGFRPSARQVGGGVIALLLLVFIFSNNETVEVSLLLIAPTLPLWTVLGLTALAGFLVGMLLGGRRAKRKR